MRKFWKLTTVTGVAVVVAAMAAAGPAGAITSPPSGYGFDGHPNVIVAGGSDTTAKVMLAIGDLYNASAINNGCHHSQNNTVTTIPGTQPFQNACDNTDEPFNLSNYDGDTLALANPTGSGAGRKSLEGLGGGTYEGTVNTLANPARVDANVQFHGSSSQVDDTAITAGDLGKLVTSASADANVPQPVYVGTVTPGVGFLLSASAAHQENDNYLSSSTPGLESISISQYGCIAPGPTIGPVNDIGRSSSTAGSLAGCTNSSAGPSELGATTFWGFARDMVEVYGFNGNGVKLNGLSNFTANQISDIWDDHDGTNAGPLCPNQTSTTKHYMTWHQLDPVAWPTGDAYANAPIVPWKMNTGSGTYGTFNSYVQTHVTNGDTTFDGSGAGDFCARTLSNGLFPLENDIKPLLDTPVTLSSSPASIDNPQNWINWASFGVFSAFPYTSAATRQTVFYQATAAALFGVLPSTSLTSTYGLTRILWNVTRKGDADCPATATAGARTCDFAGEPGPTIGAGPATDLNVTGPSTGTSGAVREFIRYLCRGNATQEGTDPFTGNNYFNEITGALIGAGFTVLPAANRTSGSRCNVVT